MLRASDVDNSGELDLAEFVAMITGQASLEAGRRWLTHIGSGLDGGTLTRRLPPAMMHAQPAHGSPRSNETYHPVFDIERDSTAAAGVWWQPPLLQTALVVHATQRCRAPPSLVGYVQPML